MNDVDRTNHYLKAGNKGAAAANLGVYMSDLSCLITHGKRDEANRYFQACLALSEFIGMKKQFSQAIQIGFNDIIEGDEKLEKSLANLFKDATNTAEQEEFKKLHASALTGYYIEELYLLAFFLKSYRSTEGPDSVFFAALSIFANQKDELNNLITYFDHVQLKPPASLLTKICFHYKQSIWQWIVSDYYRKRIPKSYLGIKASWIFSILYFPFESRSSTFNQGISADLRHLISGFSLQ